MKIVSILLFVFFYSFSGAQTLLTIDDAINIALKNNYDIQIARNSVEIDKLNNTPGNAGMLPDVSASGSGFYELSDVHQELAGGSENNYDALSTKSVSADVELNWTLFDGGKMFVTKNKLAEIQALGEIEFKDAVLQKLFEVISAYYDIVRQKQQLNSINEVINFNRERVKIAQAGFAAGSLIKPEVLQAKIDLNVTMENAINQQFIIDAAKRRLNEILSQSSENNFEVTDSIPLGLMPDKTKLLQQIDSLNTKLLASQKQIDIAKLNIKEFNRRYSPTVDFKAGYYFSESANSDGTLLANRSTGPSVGGTITIPLFSAGENKRLAGTAKIQLQSATLEYQNIQLQVNTELQNALTAYENQIQLLKIEQENYELTRENLEISLQRLRLGQTISLEVHQAQEYFVQSGTRLINFQYNLKIAEIKLKQLAAQL